MASPSVVPPDDITAELTLLRPPSRTANGPSSGEEGIFIIHLGSSENRITPAVICLFTDLLDEIEKTPGPKACILTGTGKFFSNGLHFEALAVEHERTLFAFHNLLKKLLIFGVPIISAINGHAFAGGAMISLACDYRVMNKKRGFLSINEIDIGLHLTPGLYAIVRAKAPRNVWTKLILTGKRWTADELVEAHLIDVAVAADEVLPKAISIAKTLLPKGENTLLYRVMKKQMYYHEIELLNQSFGADHEKLKANVTSKY